MFELPAWMKEQDIGKKKIEMSLNYPGLDPSEIEKRCRGAS